MRLPIRLVLGLLGFVNAVQAQRADLFREGPGTWLLSGAIGTTYYTGDLTEAGNVGHLRLGVLVNIALARRLSDKLSLRAEAQVYYIRGSQKNTHLYYNNLSFFSINPDAWVGVQYDFIPTNHRTLLRIPYALAGAGVTYMSPRARYQGHTYSLAPLHTEGVVYSRWSPIIRYGVGVPLVVSERLKLQLEATYTHVLSDYLDDVSTTYPDFSTLTPIGQALSDRAAEGGYAPNRPGMQRGNHTRRDGYFSMAGRVVWVVGTAQRQRYRRQLGW